MQTNNSTTTLISLLKKNGFEVKMAEKSKIIAAVKKNYPMLYFEVIKNGFLIRRIKQLNEKAFLSDNNIFEFVNALNQKTIMCKYVFTSNNHLEVTAMLNSLENEVQLEKLLRILKHDIKQVILENKESKKYLSN